MPKKWTHTQAFAHFGTKPKNVLWLFRSAPRLIRLLCCAAFQSRLHLRSRESGRLAIGLGLRLSQQLRQLGDIAGNPSRLIFAEQLGC